MFAFVIGNGAMPGGIESGALMEDVALVKRIGMSVILEIISIRV